MLGINSYIPSNLGGDIDQLLVNAFNHLTGNISLDLDSPIILSPDDFTIELGSLDVLISWDVIENNQKNYTVELDGIQIEASIWLPDSPITIDISGLNNGVYHYNLTVFDTSGNFATDEVVVSVIDTNSPNIIGPTDIELLLDEQGVEIGWIVEDEDPDAYTLTHNETDIISGNWISGEMISLVLEGLEEGFHIYHLTVVDQTGNVADDELVVHILPSGIPSLSSPADMYFAEGDINQRITWYVSDNDPTFYILEINELVFTNSSWVAQPFVEIHLQTYISGYYNFTLSLFDESNNMISDTVFVQIYALNPQTNNPPPPSNPSPSIPQNVFFVAIAAIGVLSIFMIIRRIRGL